MFPNYAYTPHIWPLLVTAAFLTVIGLYAGSRQSLPGARPLAFLMLSSAVWAVSNALELAAVDASTKVFWFLFIYDVCMMPSSVARLCFVLEYAGLRRWMNRRTLAVLSIPVVLQWFLALTNDSHHLVWSGLSIGETVRPIMATGYWLLAGMAYLMLLAIVIIFGWLFLRSPQHRWPVALMLTAMLGTHASFLLASANINPLAPLEPNVLSMAFSSAVYTLALFYFRIFDPIPAARKTVIEQMREGMLVLDNQGKIIDTNSAAERILGLPRS